MSRQGRWEYLKAIHPRYRQASRAEKQRILDEFCHVTRYHRKSALRLLNGPPPGRQPPRRRRPPACQYSTRVIQVLAAIWAAAGYPWSVRLKALLPLWLPWARTRFRLTPALEAQLLALSPRQMDRRLRPYKGQLKNRLYGRTKPGTLLKHHIPLQTDRWDVTVPGFTEIDLVAHSSECGEGEFVHSLNQTDRTVMGDGHEFMRFLRAPSRTATPLQRKASRHRSSRTLGGRPYDGPASSMWKLIERRTFSGGAVSWRMPRSWHRPCGI